MSRDRVLLPESFIWVRLFQTCTFGVPRERGISSLLPVVLSFHFMSSVNESQEDNYHLNYVPGLLHKAQKSWLMFPRIPVDLSPSGGNLPVGAARLQRLPLVVSQALTGGLVQLEVQPAGLA